MSHITGASGADVRARDAWLTSTVAELMSASPYAEHSTVDGADEQLIAQATSRSLFATTRIVTVNVTDDSSEENVRQVCAKAGDDLLVVINQESGRSTWPKKLVTAGGGTWSTFSLPERPGPAAIRIAWWAGENNIALGSAQRAILASAATADLAAADSAITACRLVGLTNPTVAQLKTLLGSAKAPAFGFEILELIRSQDLPGALALARDLDGPPTAALLTKHFAIASALAEGPENWQAWSKAAKVSEYQERQARASLRVWGGHGVRERWAVSAALTPQVRSGGTVALLALICAICDPTGQKADIGAQADALTVGED